jgi:ribonuclease D
MTETSLQVDLTSTEIQHAETAVHEARMIGPETDLAQPVSLWSQATTLGLDTEFVRERTFYPRPGLVQLSDGKAVWLLDPIGRDDFPCFGDILNNRNIIKILHSVGEDLEIFSLLTGTLPDPLFDTQIAAAMLGMPLQCRYENLVEQTFGVHLPGGQARSDWCRRPLAETLLHYAAQDVIWLPRLQEELGAALEGAGRLDWLEEDCRRLVQRASASDEASPLLRVKGAGRLDDQALAWLEQLAGWREGLARKRDLPRGFVVRDEVLINLAACAHDPSARDQALDTLPQPVKRHYAKELKALLEGNTPGDFIRPPELIAPDAEQRQALKQAQAAVRQIADEMAIDPALIASKRELAKLIRGDNPDWMNGWRGEVLGDLVARLPG